MIGERDLNWEIIKISEMFSNLVTYYHGLRYSDIIENFLLSNSEIIKKRKALLICRIFMHEIKNPTILNWILDGGNSSNPPFHNMSNKELMASIKVMTRELERRGTKNEM